MEEADKDWMMLDQDGGWVSVSSGTGSPGSPGQKLVKRLLLLLSVVRQIRMGWIDHSPIRILVGWVTVQFVPLIIDPC